MNQYLRPSNSCIPAVGDMAKKDVSDVTKIFVYVLALVPCVLQKMIGSMNKSCMYMVLTFKLLCISKCL